MQLPDVNVLVHAHREDAPHHAECHAWLSRLAAGDAAFGLSELVLSGFLRVVTHPKVFGKPTPLAAALEFADQLRSLPQMTPVAPGRRHWGILTGLCSGAGTKGNLVSDAYLAAMAIESGCEWITTDRDFSRFDGLRWRHPAR